MEPNPTRGAQIEPCLGQLSRAGRKRLPGTGKRHLSSLPMTVHRQQIGRAAEELVANRLAAASWEILERNARTRYGELDIVALDGRTLVFVEVKAGREGSAYGPERPVLAVDRRKQQRIRRLATAWMGENRTAVRYDEIRFDAIGVTFNRSGRVIDLEHLVAAF
jgi:putative endonuclease